MFTSDFAEALEYWRASGGAIVYHAPLDGSAEGWQVDEPEDLIRQGWSDLRAAARRAMQCGGLSGERIDAELADWTDPADPVLTRRERRRRELYAEKLRAGTFPYARLALAAAAEVLCAEGDFEGADLLSRIAAQLALANDTIAVEAVPQ